jgi:hypothetical protein
MPDAEPHTPPPARVRYSIELCTTQQPTFPWLSWSIKLLEPGCTVVPAYVQANMGCTPQLYIFLMGFYSSSLMVVVGHARNPLLYLP